MAKDIVTTLFQQVVRDNIEVVNDWSEECRVRLAEILMGKPSGSIISATFEKGTGETDIVIKAIMRRFVDLVNVSMEVR